MKEAATEMGVSYRWEPGGEGGLEGNVLKETENWIWPKTLEELLQKWQVAPEDVH